MLGLPIEKLRWGEDSPKSSSENRRLVQADGDGAVYTGPGEPTVAETVWQRYLPKPYWRLRAALAAEPGGTALILYERPGV